MSWQDGGAAYIPSLNAAEVTYGIPANLLARMAYEECSWRAEVISGEIKSPAGAVGMMQLMPEYFPGAGVSWKTDILTAAHYVTSLYKQFNDWQLAVASYNWGPGNVVKYLADDSIEMPNETTHYVAQIFADVPVSGALVDV